MKNYRISIYQWYENSEDPLELSSYSVHESSYADMVIVSDIQRKYYIPPLLKMYRNEIARIINDRRIKMPTMGQTGMYEIDT